MKQLIYIICLLVLIWDRLPLYIDTWLNGKQFRFLAFVCEQFKEEQWQFNFYETKNSLIPEIKSQSKHNRVE